MSRWRAFFQKKRLDRELDEEMRLHIEMEAADLQSRGVAPDIARREATIAFGGVERYKEAHRDARGIRWLEDALADLRYAARALIRSPAFTLSSVLVLALGIGASTTIFGAIDAVLLTRLPYSHDERLVEIGMRNGDNTWHLSAVDYRALESDQRSFTALGAESPNEVAVRIGNADAVRQSMAFVTSGVFRALGVTVASGRAIQPSDETPGAPAVAVVSAQMATRAGLGQTITIGGVPHTIVGVLPPGVTTLGRLSGDIWPVLQVRPPTRRGPFFLIGLARLKDGVTVDAATRDLAGISERIFPIWASSFQARSARILPMPLRERVLGDASHTLGVFGGAVALVLLVAVANVSSLALVRATNRQRELSVRAMLGGTRGRLARLLVAESLLLAVTGAVAGVLVAILGLRVLVAIGPHVPRLADAKPDVTMLGFAAVVAIVIALIVGGAPVWLLARGHAMGSRVIGAARGTQATRAGFVIAQFALTLPLLAGAGLLLNSFLRLARVRPGFDASGLAMVHVSLPFARYGNDTTIAAYWVRALPVIRDVPGVLDAGLTEFAPPNEPAMDFNNFALMDRPAPADGGQPESPWITATADYFRTLRVPLLDGRLFTLADSASAPPVVVVSRAWANHYYPDGRAVGHQMMPGGCTTCPPTTIVGIVGDIKVQGLDAPADAIYVPPTQGWPPQFNVIARTAGPPAEAAKRMVAALRTLDAGVPLDHAMPLEDRVYDSVTQPRHWTMLLGGFAAAALMLAAVGVFGLLSYNISTRRREIGVRMALGARASAVINMFVWRGMGHALLGTAIGLVLALWSSHALSSALFG
ncbi:MAG TPA: ADOP family duplicated permease, partial [Gemmatimonadaceae bacterium]|nr:ADOP family duplicated permease [Gemmatimonadaceae bacterium]